MARESRAFFKITLQEFSAFLCIKAVWEIEDFLGHLHNHVGLTENFDQSENEEFLVNDSP